jgi:hypothetical protein
VATVCRNAYRATALVTTETADHTLCKVQPLCLARRLSRQTSSDSLPAVGYGYPSEIAGDFTPSTQPAVVRLRISASALHLAHY